MSFFVRFFLNCLFRSWRAFQIPFIVIALLGATVPGYGEESKKPNILLISIDDLNDWVGVLDGHPQAYTPNIDRLAKSGVLFSNAQCQSPVCNPSRASLMTSLYPSTTGIYFLDPDLKQSEIAAKSRLMPERFQDDGYKVFGAGKLFHGKGQNENWVPNYAGRMGGFGPIPNEKLTTYPGHRLWDWGVYPETDEEMPDHRIATWAEAELAKEHEEPFWMGVGFFRPHVPQYAPQKWFDMFPLESIVVPETLLNDLNDVPQYGIDLTREKHVSPTHEWVMDNDELKPLVQSYLACVAFVDHQVGRVLDALEKSRYHENTYVVLWSDHGFHFGEKERYAKRSLWEDGTRVPVIVSGPGLEEDLVVKSPVELIDIYPTLLELAGLEADPSHEGDSLKPLLEGSSEDWPHLARSNYGPGNYAIVSERYRYIHYNNGSEEFYDRQDDPNEWHNLIDSIELKGEIERHRREVPDQRHPIIEGIWTVGHEAFKVAESRVE